MVTLTTIGIIRSPYKEKFAVPRQPSLVESGTGELHLLPPYNHIDAVRGLEQFSHIWLLFIFHKITRQTWKPLVRPPRLGGNCKTGVFATRSPFRPNSIGLSLVELKDIIYRKPEIILKLGSIDLVDGTPIVDIKPYLPFAESKPYAQAGFAQSAPQKNMDVVFTPQCQQILQYHLINYPSLKVLIEQVLSQDPRPAYRQKDKTTKNYAIHLFDFNIKWTVKDDKIVVFNIELIVSG